MDRKLFQDTFSALHAPEARIQEVLSMTESMTPQKPRRIKRAVLLTAAVMASLCVCVGAANAATNGVVLQTIEYYICETLQIDAFHSTATLDNGTKVDIYSTDAIDLVREEDRIILSFQDERIDITDELAENKHYSHTFTDGASSCQVEIMPDDVYGPDEWRYEATIVIPGEDGAETTLTRIGSTSPDAEDANVGAFATTESSDSHSVVYDIVDSDTGSVSQREVEVETSITNVITNDEK